MNAKVEVEAVGTFGTTTIVLVFMCDASLFTLTLTWYEFAMKI